MKHLVPCLRYAGPKDIRGNPNGPPSPVASDIRSPNRGGRRATPTVLPQGTHLEGEGCGLLARSSPNARDAIAGTCGEERRGGLAQPLGLGRGAAEPTGWSVVGFSASKSVLWRFGGGVVQFRNEHTTPAPPRFWRSETALVNHKQTSEEYALN